MLDCEFSPADNSFVQDFLMDPMPLCASQLNVDDQASFGTYTAFLSEAYPFFIPQSFAPDISHPHSKGQAYPDPSESSIIASQSELLSSASSISTRSVGSVTSSCIGSPKQELWTDMNPVSSFDQHATLNARSRFQDYSSTEFSADSQSVQDKISNCFVDPSLIQPVSQPSDYQLPIISYPGDLQFCFVGSSNFPSTSSGVASPTLSHQQPQQLYQAQSEQSYQLPQKRKADFSPSMNHNALVPEMRSYTRRSSISSLRSHPSVSSPRPSSIEVEDEGKEKGRCPHPNCGKVFKDLKAHMLTHQSERPEKCPIVNCEYHLKGFARKYDKNRHTLTHYKGTMVCGFCPGSGSAAEKSFNRADVFKRHLTSVHGVDQSAPNGRKKTPPSAIGKPSSHCQEATGKCSTCSATFSSAQEFYEHLDDCVLRVVQQEEPSEAINFRRLTEVASDEAVKQTMKRHMLVDSAPSASPLTTENEHEDESFIDSFHHVNSNNSLSKSNTVSRFLPANLGGISKAKPSVSRRRNNRNNYPPSWGCPTNKMKMKRRLLCLYDGPRRLWKDEMMLDNEFEVRLNLPGGDGMGREAYVTDLDVETLKRAEGVLNATDEEKGPWDPTSASHGLLGPAAVPVLGNSNDIVDEVNIDELMS